MDGEELMDGPSEGAIETLGESLGFPVGVSVGQPVGVSVGPIVAIPVQNLRLSLRPN